MGPYYPKKMRSPGQSPSVSEPELARPPSAALGATGETETTYLVLGPSQPTDELAFVKRKLDARKNVGALGPEDVGSNNTGSTDVTRALADYADYVVVVDDGGYEPGPLFELGTLVTNSMFFDKLFALVRTPREKRAESPVRANLYELIDYHGRLYEWETTDDLDDIVESLPADSA